MKAGMPLQEFESATVPLDSSTNPGALVVQERTSVPAERKILRLGTTWLSAGGVTLAHEVPMRISSAKTTAGSAAFRLKSTKLAICDRSPPALVANVGGGALAWPKVEAGGLIHICETSSLVAAGLKV